MTSIQKSVFIMTLLLTTMPVMARVFVGETGKFDKVSFSMESLNINRQTNSIRIQATNNLQINDCTVFYRNGGQELFQVGQLNTNQSYRYNLRNSRMVIKLQCYGSTTNFIGSRGRLKVYINPSVIRPGPRPPRPIPPGPRPGPRPPRPIPPGPRPAPRPTPVPRVVQVRPIVKKVCVKKSSKMIQLNTQAQYWKVNGASSRLSTWKYPGRIAILTMDYATANVHAYCKRAGREAFNIQWKLAFTDPNVYQTQLTVNCVPCAPARVAKNAQSAAKKAFQIYKRGKVNAALNELEKFIRNVNDNIAEGKYSEEEIQMIERVIFRELNRLRDAILEGYAEEVIENILLSLNRL